MIASRRIRLRMTNISEKNCRENQNTYFVFRNLFFFFENHVVMEENTGKNYRSVQATDDNITRGMRIVCRTSKATVTHSEHIIFITFPL